MVVNCIADTNGKSVANLNRVEEGYSYQMKFASLPGKVRVHIRKFVDDHIVYAYFNSGRGWTYRIKNKYYFKLLAEHGVIYFNTPLKTPVKYFYYR